MLFFILWLKTETNENSMNRMLKIAAGGTALAGIELYVLGAYAGIGPFGTLFHKRNGKLPGNNEQYDFRFLQVMD